MTDSVELATGYISLAATTKGLGRQVSREFAGIERDADRTGKRSGKRFGLAFGGVLKAGALGAAVAGVVAARGINAAIDSASGLEQSVGGVKSVFKGYAKTIDKESRGAAKSVGLSKDAYNELATVIGASLKNKGVKDFGKETQNLIGLGSDMAAQFGGSTKDAVEAIGAALRGESDPIERYGVSLNESAVSAVLAAKGQDKLKGAALDQAKAQARLKILFDQTKDAQGAFGRESDTHAGKLQRAAAGWENVKAKIGELFLPTATKALGFISDRLLPGLERFATFLSVNVGPAFAKVKAFLTPLVAVVRGLFAAITSGQSSAGFLQTKLIPALQGIVAAGVRLAAVVLPILKAIAAEFLRNWPIIKPVVMEIFSTIGGIVTDVMTYVKKYIQTVTKIISFIWSRWGTQITAIVGSTFRLVIRVLGGAFKIIGGLVKVITGVMTGDWKKAGEGVKQIIRGLVQIAVAIFKNWMAVTHALLGGLVVKMKARWNEFLSWTSSRLRSGLARIREFILAPIRAAHSGISTLLTRIRDRFSSGVAAIGRAWEGLREKAASPIRFVVNTVINRGLIGAFNKIAGVLPGVGPLPNVSAGFHAGGWTGPGAKMKPAGVVHADEYVINKASRRKIERDQPGLLDRLNGYATGGLVGGSGRFSDLFASRLLAAQRIAGTQFRIFQRGFRPATSYSGTSHRGDAVDLGPITSAVIRALRSVGIAAWDRTGKGNWVPHIHGVPLPGAGFAGGSGVSQAQAYLRGGDGLGGRDNGPRVGVLGRIGAFVTAGFSSIKDWFKGLIKDPLAKLSRVTSSPLGRLAAGVPRMLVEGMSNRVERFDTGGVLRPGLTLAYNGTGRNERVVGPTGSGGNVIHMNFPSSPNPEVLHAAAGGRLVAALEARGW